MSSMTDTTGGSVEAASDPIFGLQSGVDQGGKNSQHANDTTTATLEGKQEIHSVLRAEETLKPEKARSGQQDPEPEPQLIHTIAMAEGIPDIDSKVRTPLGVQNGPNEAIDFTKSPITSELIDFTIDSPSINSHHHIEPVLPHRMASIETLTDTPREDEKKQMAAAKAQRLNAWRNLQHNKPGFKGPSLPIRSSNSHSLGEMTTVNEGLEYDLDELVVESEDREREIRAHETRVRLLKWKMAQLQELQRPCADLPGFSTDKTKIPAGVHQPNANQRLESMHVAEHIPGMVAGLGNMNIASFDLNRPLADTTPHLAPLNLQPVSGQAPNEPMVRPMEPSFHQDVFSRPTQKQQAIVQPPQSAYTHGYHMKSSGPIQSQMHGVQECVGLLAQTSCNLDRKLLQIDEHDCGDESDDDEPLITRTKRHPSIAKACGPGSKMLMDKGEGVAKTEDDSDVEWVKSNPKGAALAPKEATNAFDQSSTGNAALSTTQEDASDDGLFDWKIPKYEVLFEAPASKDEPAIARVSIPGAPRENMYLSPDHEQQEMELLLNIFLPGQQKLEKPDPEPAHAILNFHTIAVMVIEAYKQFEIGDEFGTGRGHWHNDHDQGNEEYERLRDARDADTDEIFFSVIDRWRTGLEVKKQPCLMIRGAQEFCDTALDIIYYFKEHGLIVEPKRKNRSDKGAKRGPKATGSKTAGLEPVGSKRTGDTEVNEVQARKKVKTDPKAKAPSKKKSDAGVSVVRTPKK